MDNQRLKGYERICGVLSNPVKANETPFYSHPSHCSWFLRVLLFIVDMEMKGMISFALLWPLQSWCQAIPFLFSSIAYLSHTLSFSSQGRVPLVKLHTLHGTTERAQCSQDRSHWVAFVRFIAAETAQWRDSACCRRMKSVSQQGQPSLRSGRVFVIPFQAHRFAKTHNPWLMNPILAIHLGSTRHVLVASEPDRHHSEQYCPSIVLTPKENRSYP